MELHPTAKKIAASRSAREFAVKPERRAKTTTWTKHHRVRDVMLDSYQRLPVEGSALGVAD